MNTLPHADTASSTEQSRPWPGLWAAAFRVHRPLLITASALCVLLVGVLVAFRLGAGRRLTELSEARGLPCAEPLSATPSADCQTFLATVDWNGFTGVFRFLQLASLLLAIGLGALVGAPVFAREFEQRTQVLSLTQSVGRTRWWVAKTGIAVVPLVVLLLAVGAVAHWAFTGWPFSGVAMESAPFLSTSLSPAVVGVLAAALGVTAGVLSRSTVGALVIALVLGAGIVYAVEIVRPHVVPADRSVLPATGNAYAFSWSGETWLIEDGWVDGAGTVVTWDRNCQLWNELDPSVPLTDEESVQVMSRCYELAGISGRYIDVIPESRFWLVRGAWAGGMLALSGMVLLAGLGAIRRRVL